MQTAKRASTTIRGGYVGNNPANWVDPWGLSASDGQKNSPTFGSVAKNFGIGFAQGAWGAVKNIGQFIAHPIKTVQATANGITQFGKNLYNDPRGTYNSIKNSVVGAYTTFKNADANEKARIVGNVTGHIAVDVAAGAAGKFAIGKVKSLIKVTKNSNGKTLYNFGESARQHMLDPHRKVPLQILNEAITNTKGLPDPKGSQALMYYSRIIKNQKTYNLEILYDKSTNSIWHFKYSQKALGPLSSLQ